jgi:hypothetical protein
MTNSIATPEKAKKARKKVVEGDLTQIEESIRSKYADFKGNMRISFLWVEHDVHRFRINWWGTDDNGNTVLLKSKFVLVSDGKIEERG